MAWMRLAAAAAAALALLAAPALASPKPPAKSWAQPAIELVAKHGLLGGDAKAFRPDDPLTAGDLAALVSELSGTEAPYPPDPSAPVSMAALDAQLVRALGLRSEARRFAQGVRDAGLVPPSRFGTEVVARLLGLRTDHSDDTIELGPADLATRAEAAYSTAKILQFAGWEVPTVKSEAQTFVLPTVTGWQAAVLQTAVRLIGYPYVWGGTSEHRQAPFGSEVSGGFDCSGFVWRVFKLGGYAGGENLADTLRGRTTYAMSGEVPRAKRIARAALEPADVLFFGEHGPRSKPAEVDHAGIYLGNGWFIQAGVTGVALIPLASPWYDARFAWARRPLAEAGLVQEH
jgi:cell wall-associated NlpC family hydrolase